jgi:hypothetical protein
MASVAVIVAIAVKATAARVSWHGCRAQARAARARGVKLLISDAHEGIKAAVAVLLSAIGAAGST